MASTMAFWLWSASSAAIVALTSPSFSFNLAISAAISSRFSFCSFCCRSASVSSDIFVVNSSMRVLRATLTESATATLLANESRASRNSSFNFWQAPTSLQSLSVGIFSRALFAASNFAIAAVTLALSASAKSFASRAFPRAIASSARATPSTCTVMKAAISVCKACAAMTLPAFLDSSSFCNIVCLSCNWPSRPVMLLYALFASYTAVTFLSFWVTSSSDPDASVSTVSEIVFRALSRAVVACPEAEAISANLLSLSSSGRLSQSSLITSYVPSNSLSKSRFTAVPDSSIVLFASASFSLIASIMSALLRGSLNSSSFFTLY